MSEPSVDGGHSEDTHEARKRLTNPAEKLADVFVFAPIGFLSEAGRLWPEVVAAGREHVDVALALRESAVAKTRDWLVSRAGAGTGEASAALRGLGLTRDRVDGDSQIVPSAATKPASTSSEQPDSAGRSHTQTRAVPPPDLAIPDYDLLSASQVVPRLDALASDELEAVRLHEHAHRSRRTILSKIAQLQAG